MCLSSLKTSVNSLVLTPHTFISSLNAVKQTCSCFSAFSIFLDCHTASGETPSLHGPSDGPVLGTGETKTSSNRKSTSDESEEGPRRRSRGTPSSAEDHNQTFSSSSSTEDAGTSTLSIVSRNSRKRKSEETEGPRKRSRKTPGPVEGPNQQASTEASSSDRPGTSSSANTAPPDSRG